jgi:hypothetical protein
LQSFPLLSKCPIGGALPVRRAHKAEVCTVGRAVQRGAESGEGVRSSPSKRSGETAAPPAEADQGAPASEASLFLLMKQKVSLSSRKGKRARERQQPPRTAGARKRAGAGEGNAHPRRQAPAERRSAATFCFSLKKQQLSQLLHRGGLRHPPMSDL